MLTLKCAHCGKPAFCFGRYEDQTGPAEPACDDCCGHGCEDGWCVQIEGSEGLISHYQFLQSQNERLARALEWALTWVPYSAAPPFEGDKVHEAKVVLAEVVHQKARAAPDWLLKRMEVVRQMPPPTLEELRAQWEASAEVQDQLILVCEKLLGWKYLRCKHFDAKHPVIDGWSDTTKLKCKECG